MISCLLTFCIERHGSKSKRKHSSSDSSSSSESSSGDDRRKKSKKKRPSKVGIYGWKLGCFSFAQDGYAGIFFVGRLHTEVISVFPDVGSAKPRVVFLQMSKDACIGTLFLSRNPSRRRAERSAAAEILRPHLQTRIDVLMF